MGRSQTGGLCRLSHQLTKGRTMTDERRRRPVGFTQGALSDSVEQTQQMLEEWFDDIDFTKYHDAYREIALSGANAALEALGRQQLGPSASSGDPVDIVRFVADTWFSGSASAWKASLDLSR